MSAPKLSVAQRRQAHLSGLATDIAQRNDYEVSALSRERYSSPLTAGGNFLTVSNTAYWVYIGQTTRDIVATQIYFFVSVVGVGTLVQELALARTDAGPDRAAKTITVLATKNATGDYTAATGSYTNTTSFATRVLAGTHLWLGCRFALTSTPTQPTLAGLVQDLGQGAVLSTASAGVLAANTNYTGALITQNATLTTVMGPSLTLVAS